MIFLMDAEQILHEVDATLSDNIKHSSTESLPNIESPCINMYVHVTDMLSGFPKQDIVPWHYSRSNMPILRYHTNVKLKGGYYSFAYHTMLSRHSNPKHSFLNHSYLIPPKRISMPLNSIPKTNTPKRNTLFSPSNYTMMMIHDTQQFIVQKNSLHGNNGHYMTKEISLIKKQTISKKIFRYYHQPVTIPYHIISYNTIPYHTISDHTIPYHTILYHTIPYYTTPYHAIPYHTIPYKKIDIYFNPL